MSELLVRNLTKTYATRGEPLLVLRGVTFDLRAGQSMAVVGPSGCGKSTLLHIVGTLESPTEGTVTLDGVDLAALAEPELAALRNRKIGFVFQDHHLLPQCTVLENVLVPALAAGSPGPQQIQRARQLLDRVGLGQRLDHRPAELSGGERQRAAIARALALSPLLLLADEPTGNLDRDTAETVTDVLLDLQRQEGLMMIVVTHSGSLAARLERRFELNGGRLQRAD